MTSKASCLQDEPSNNSAILLSQYQPFSVSLSLLPSVNIVDEVSKQQDTELHSMSSGHSAVTVLASCLPQNVCTHQTLPKEKPCILFLQYYLALVAIVMECPKLQVQALVYNILPSTTAIFSYAIGSRKLSANKQFFIGAQTVVSLLQTTQIISDICFITDHVVYASSNNTKIILIKTELFLPRVDAPHVYVHAWALGRFHSPISTRTFQRALTALVDSCAEIKSAPSVV